MKLLETRRLVVRTAAPRDAEMFFELWTDPCVMGNVGFPGGLRVTTEEIRERIRKQTGAVFDLLLVVVLRSTGEVMGECGVRRPDPEGIASTDIKLLPAYWGNRYGIEIKRALLSFLFNGTGCSAVEATPSVDNIASIRMQEEAGGVLVGEGVYEFPESMKEYTAPVHHFVYRISRSDWTEAMNSEGEKMKRIRERDIEKTYSRGEFVRKLRRLADSIENGTPFRIQIAGVRITVPPEAVANIEHERGRHEEEIEFQLKWRVE